MEAVPGKEATSFRNFYKFAQPVPGELLFRP